VIDHAVSLNQYQEIYLIGFSLGGNLTLKYLGENRSRPSALKKAMAFSVPMNLHTSCLEISKPSNRIYSNRFLKSLRKKVILKARSFPELDARALNKIKTLSEFDDQYTGPIHGFKNAIDYYEQCSSIRFVNDITIPTKIISALNDPFLSVDCYPTQLLQEHPWVQFESPQHGGHVGFAQFNKNGLYWSEQQALEFFMKGSA